MGVADRAVFTGYAPEDEKIDRYRLASVESGIPRAPDRPHEVPGGLDYFSVKRSQELWHRLIDDCFLKKSTTENALC